MRAMGFETASALVCAAATEPYRVGQLLNLKVAGKAPKTGQAVTIGGERPTVGRRSGYFAAPSPYSTRPHLFRSSLPLFVHTTGARGPLDCFPCPPSSSLPPSCLRAFSTGRRMFKTPRRSGYFAAPSPYRRPRAIGKGHAPFLPARHHCYARI
jgi:hypothetical protein